LSALCRITVAYKLPKTTPPVGTINNMTFDDRFSEDDVDLTIELDPAQAASGTTKAITAPVGPDTESHVFLAKIPPAVLDGTLLRLPGRGTPDSDGNPGDLLVRVRVRRRPDRGKRGYILALTLAMAVAVAAITVSSIIYEDSSDSASITISPTGEPTTFSSTWPRLSSATTVPPTSPAIPSAPPTTSTANHFEVGICLTGTLPDSPVPVAVYNVSEISCLSPGAHYKVIQSFSGTNDMTLCDANTQTQYAFSSETILSNTTAIRYVYCLVGIGEYAR
jgi:DnaJ C terminal domain